MNALNPSHAALVAEVTALRATLNDAVELCESLRSERDAAVRSYSVLADERDKLHDAVQELGSYAELKLAGHRQDYAEEHCMVQTAIRMVALARAALGRSASL